MLGAGLGTGRGLAAFAPIASATTSTTPTAFARLLLSGRRTCFRFDNLRFGLGVRIGFHGRRLLDRRCDRIKNCSAVLERRTGFGNRGRDKLGKIELRIAGGFSPQSSC